MKHKSFITFYKFSVTVVVMSEDGLKPKVNDAYDSLQELLKSTYDLQNLLAATELSDTDDDEFDDEYDDMFLDDKIDDDDLQSLIDYNTNDVLSTPLPRINDCVEIQIDDVSEDVKRNAVVNVRNFTREMDYKDVRNVLLDYDGIVDIGDMFHYFDLDNLIIKNVDIFSWYNVLPDCNVGTIRFENCELTKHYSVQTLSDDVETSLDFIFKDTDLIMKIECVNCSIDFVDALLLGIDKVGENHRFGNIEIEIK